MSESHRTQEIIQYLLGALPEAKTERFDDLSISNPEFADELNATEQNLLDAYVQGELTGATLERFESHYLASPLRREKVEFARAFQDFAGRNWTERPQEVPITPAHGKRAATDSLAGLRVWHQSLILRWSLAAAAALVLAAGGWWALQSRGDREGVVATFVLAPPLRGSDQVPTFSIPQGSAAVEIQLELEASDHASYRVALTDESGGAELWRSDSLEASREKNPRVAVRFPAQLLQGKIYSLVVSSINPDGSEEVISNYPFRVQMQ